MTNLRVVPLREDPPISDIVGQLRKLAAEIESGDIVNIHALFAVIPVESGFPLIYGWGDVNGRNDPIIQMEMAKLWFIKQRTYRDHA